MQSSEWYIGQDVVQQRTGNFFLTLMNLATPIKKEELASSNNVIDEKNLRNITEDYAFKAW